jgi:hypothetical protein
MLQQHRASLFSLVIWKKIDGILSVNLTMMTEQAKIFYFFASFGFYGLFLISRRLRVLHCFPRNVTRLLANSTLFTEALLIYFPLCTVASDFSPLLRYGCLTGKRFIIVNIRFLIH